ncbi:DUF2859 domain-containing protein [Diaphorobacter sp. HDW4A]|uniref:DUF2859 domain-containing protein n=1 Tax=Diaphorobacter sp. HDW4A TaxID=2714924 RepID=UPI00140B05B6|nr:DUF2859 domain-containing protein [Diaphorobacter sp. HDW4A]QIL80324.1 DUF2859 domain-containing protein [Diaphorobacter sp. HDW4A]
MRFSSPTYHTARRPAVHRIAAVLGCAIQCTAAYAGTEDTVPAAPYYSAIVQGDGQEGVLHGVRFPLRPALLRPGVLPSEGIPVFGGKWMTQSLALVGDDAASRQWLALHLERLLSLGTAVIVVAAASEGQFKELQRQVAGLAIAPDTGVWLQQRLATAGAGVYPLFIGVDGLARQHIFSLGSASAPPQTSPSEAHP